MARLEELKAALHGFIDGFFWVGEGAVDEEFGVEEQPPEGVVLGLPIRQEWLGDIGTVKGVAGCVAEAYKVGKESKEAGIVV